MKYDNEMMWIRITNVKWRWLILPKTLKHVGAVYRNGSKKEFTRKRKWKCHGHGIYRQLLQYMARVMMECIIALVFSSVSVCTDRRSTSDRIMVPLHHRISSYTPPSCHGDEWTFRTTLATRRTYVLRAYFTDGTERVISHANRLFWS